MTQLGCFFCNVDSRQLIWFLGLIVGSAVAATVCFAVWGILNGHLRDEHKLASAALDAEGDDRVPLEEIP